MKKIISLLSILFLMASCTSTSNKTDNNSVIKDFKHTYNKDGVYYNVFNEDLFTGIVIDEKKSNDDIYNIFKIENGHLKNLKTTENGYLKVNVNYIENNLLKGDIYFEDYNKTYNGLVNNGVFTGSIIKKSYYNDNGDTESYVNGILHGKTIQNDETIYYNKGNKVASLKQVEEFTPWEIPEKITPYDTLVIKDFIATDSENNLFTGYTQIEEWEDKTLLYFVDGNIKEKIVFKKITLNNEYDLSVDLYFPEIITKYNLDKSSTVITYSTYHELGVFQQQHEYDSEGNINGKVIEYDWAGRRIEKTQFKDDIIGEYLVYNDENEIVERHFYKDNAYTLEGYYNFENKEISVIGQGQKIDGEYYRTGNWKWFYPNTSIKYEADFFYDEQYSIVKEFYENGNLKKEGKMDYCACEYLAEFYQYNEDGSLEGVYKKDANDEIIKIGE